MTIPTQTHATIPVAGASFLTDLQTFLAEEDAARYADLFLDFVAAGGTLTTGASLTQAPTALTAYISGYYTTETGSITFTDNATTHVIADSTTTGNLGGYTRVSGTHYLTATGGSAPTLPSGTIRLATVVAVGGSITAVTDVRPLFLIDPSRGGTGLDTSTTTAGALLIGTGSGLTAATLTADTGITVTNGAGSITLAAAGQGTWAVRGHRSAVSSTTELDLLADEVVLRSATFAPAVQSDPGTLTNAITTAGPAANGRDQSGTFSSDSWIYFYWIWNGGTLATLSSATPPPDGPTLPTGYTHWAYAGAVYADSSTELVPTRFSALGAHYDAAQSAVSGGTAATETAVDLSALVPPNATSIRLGGATSIWNNLGGNVDRSDDVTLHLRVITALDAFTARHQTDSTTQYNNSNWTVTLPNVGQQVFYEWDASTLSTPNLDLVVLGYD